MMLLFLVQEATTTINTKYLPGSCNFTMFNHGYSPGGTEVGIDWVLTATVAARKSANCSVSYGAIQ